MVENLFSLNGKVVLISGGAGHLGSAMSDGFVQYGATVYIASRNIGKNAEYANYLSKKYKTNVFSEQFDTTDMNSVQSAVKRILEKEERIDVLVNNSYSGKTGDMTSVSEAAWLDSFDGSIHSTFRVTKAVLPSMVSQKSGSIINISSMYGVVSPNPEIYGDSGQNNPPQYGAAKAAIIQFTRYLAGHYGKEGIRANTISPGPFPNSEGQKNQHFISELNKKNPLNRIGNPNDLKGVAILLASDASSYITGQNICVDGGWTIW